MSLIRKLEHPIHIVEVLWVLSNSLFLVLLTLFTSLFWRLDFLHQVFIFGEELIGVDLANFR